MSKVGKRAGKMLCCFALCLALAIGYSFRAPIKVEAAAPAIVAGSVIVAAAVAALGVSITTAAAASMSGGYEAACQAFWDSLPESMRNAIVPVEIAGAVAVNTTREFLQAVADWACGSGGIIPTASSAFPSTLSIPGEINAASLCNLVGVPEGITTVSSSLKTATNLRVFYYMIPQNFKMLDGKTISYGLYQTSFALGATGTPSCPKMVSTNYYNGVKLGTDSFVDKSDYNPTGTYSMYAIIYTDNGVDYLGYITAYSEMTGSELTYEISAGRAYSSKVPAFSDSLVPSWGQDVFCPGKDAFVPNGTDVINNSAANVIDHVIDVAGTADKTIPLYVPVSGTIQDTMTSTQDTILTAPKDPGPTDPEDPDNPGGSGKPHEMPPLSLPEVIFKTKFPFCLPWDLFRCIADLAVPAKAPVFTVPLKSEEYGWDASFTIDLQPYERWAQIVRWGESIAWVILLIVITRKITGA